MAAQYKSGSGTEQQDYQPVNVSVPVSLEEGTSESNEKKPIQLQEFGYQPVGMNFTTQVSDYTPAQAVFPPAYNSNTGDSPHIQQDDSDTALVHQPEQFTPITSTAPRHPDRDKVLIFSVVTTVLGAVCCLCYQFPILICSIPALILSLLAKEDDKKGKTEVGNKKAKAAFCLNITSVVVFCSILLILTAIAIAAIILQFVQTNP